MSAPLPIARPLLAAVLVLVAGVGLAACDATDVPTGPLDGTYSGSYEVDYVPSPDNHASAVFKLLEDRGRVTGTVTFIYPSGSQSTWDVTGRYREPNFDLDFAGSFYRGSVSADGSELTGDIGANAVYFPLTARRH